MHILFIGWGDHIHLRRWADFFANYGYRITVLSIYKTEPWHPRIRVVNLHFSGNKELLRKAEIWFLLKWFKPDICHVHWARHAIYLPRSFNSAYGITAWGSDIYKNKEKPKDFQIKVIEALSKADFITCDSLDLQKEIQKLINRPEKVHVVQWGVDTKLFKPGCDVTFLRENLAIKEDHKVIYSPRSINPVYNVEIILHAFKELTQKEDKVILVQKYYNADQNRLKKLIALGEEMGIDHLIRWVGKVNYEEIPALNCLADIMVSIPSSDGTPMALLEAMACGLPPIVSDLPSVREWIKHMENGVIIKKIDSHSLYKAMNEMLNNENQRKSIAERNIKTVKNKACHYRNMGRMNDMYQNIDRLQ